MGVQHLLAEKVSEDVEGRAALRELFWRHATVTISPPSGSGGSSSGRTGSASSKSGGASKVGAKGGSGKAQDTSSFEGLHGLSSRACQLRPHRVLAMNRGEARKALRVTVALPDKEHALRALKRTVLGFGGGKGGWWQGWWRRRGGGGKGCRAGGGRERATVLEAAVSEVFSRLLQPAMAPRCGGGSLPRPRLPQPRSSRPTCARCCYSCQCGVRILGVDLAYRTGCKLAAIDASGRVLEAGSIFPTLHVRARQGRAA